MKGNYLFSIRNTGKGPGEYIGIRAFNVDEKGFIYVVNSSTDKQMIKYSPDGEYLKAIDLDRPIYAFAVLDDKIYGYNGSAQYFEENYKNAFVVLDEQGRYQRGFIQYDKPLNITPATPVFVHNNKIYLSPPYSNIIYSLTENDKLEKAYELKSAEDKKNPFVEDKFKDFYLFENALLSIADNKVNFFGADSKQGVHFNKIRSNYKKGILANHLAGVSDVIKGQQLVSVEPAHIFKMLNLQHADFKKKAPKYLVNLVENLADNDNPVLIINTVRNDIQFVDENK